MVRIHSRTTNTFYNFISSIGGQILTIVMHFVVRTVFVHTLGKSYLGISSLFSNILSMLSLAEFGVGSAIIFKLYEPIAQNDSHRITVLMKFYKAVYRYIGIVVGIIGLCFVPLLPILINDYEKLPALGINGGFIFVLYLLQSVSSYLFFAYKSAIVQANQKSYLLNIIKYVFTIAIAILQVIVLVLFNSFSLYVFILIIGVIGENIAYAILADKMYPYINEKIEDKLKIEEIRNIAKDCGALFLYKLNEVVIKSTDNVVLSIFLGLDMVALYSNYYVFYTAIKTLFEKVFSAVAHSVGDLHTTKDKEHEYEVFECVIFISSIIGGTACVGMGVVADEFVQIWIGKDWLIAQPFAILMGLEIYTMSIRKAIGKYRNTMGLFQQAKYRPLVGMLINLVISVFLVKRIGISGVLIGTIAADWLTFMWFDPLIIHRFGFKNIYSVSRYYKKVLKNFLIILGIGWIDLLICKNIMVNMGWISVIVHALICGMSVPVTLLILSINTREGRYVVKLAMKIINKVRLVKG